MIVPHEELMELARKLDTFGAYGQTQVVKKPIEDLENAAKDIAQSFSGSWLGYHSRVYYLNFQSPPAGARFSSEWGLGGDSFLGLGSTGSWQEYDPQQVRSIIYQRAGNPDLSNLRQAALATRKEFDSIKSEITSILSTCILSRPDKIIETLLDKNNKLAVSTPTDFMNWANPARQVVTRDMIAMGQGTQTPPHISVLAETTAILSAFQICIFASELCKKASAHLERLSRVKTSAYRQGEKIFIGHGRSKAWRDLKDFLQDRLSPPWDEFNRIPVAGVTNISRLSQMLDDASIAFLVMTAEDELVDGSTQARMNVVHEAGLFQGRLGFDRAIVLLEDECQDFSNIQGLGHIKFPKGNISAVFEDLRRVLEREEIIQER